VIECVVNISEGRDTAVLNALVSVVGSDLLDVHTDPDHNRSVFTLIGTTAPRVLATEAIRLLDISSHNGVHPRLGIIDVVPFVPLMGSTMTEALQARNDFALWASTTLGVPCFLYGPERSLPEVRRTAWTSLLPQHRELIPHNTAGAICVGARPVLIAYNLWLEGIDLAAAERIAGAVRTNEMRTLGLQVGEFTQVSMNLIQPEITGPMQAYEAVAEHATIHHAELVGLIPAHELSHIPKSEWEILDVSEDKTIESRLQRRS
jgi:glutamate formiminotransferase/glutamate formiminotransferase/formiminotetrahydrofolate cyclodeaminase